MRILSSSNWKNEILEYACAESLPDIWNSPDEPKLFTAKVSPPIKYPENNYWNAKSIKVICYTYIIHTIYVHIASAK